MATKTTVTQLTLDIIEFNNLAVSNDPCGAIATIFRKLADRLESEPITELEGRIFDGMGNSIGGIVVNTESEEFYNGENSGAGYEVQGTYGTGNVATIFVVGRWYCVENSGNVNKMPVSYAMRDGVNIEAITDVDMFSTKPIESIEELEKEVWGFENL